MSVLLLRLAAPMMSWGDESKFETRRTLREPTKSAVLGLIAAALGVKREDSAAWLSSPEIMTLRFGVRADKEGEVACDFHIAKGDQSNLTYRYYLHDAVFLAALESPDVELLKRFEYAVTHPVFPLFLGRRSCPPTQPLCLGIRETDLLSALRQEPSLAPGKNGDPMRIITDAAPGEYDGAAVQRDNPVSFSRARREFDFRYVTLQKSVMPFRTSTEHDPMAELR